MDRYYIYIDWKDGDTTEGYFVATNKEDAIKQALKDTDRSKIFDMCVFKELRNIKF